MRKFELTSPAFTGGIVFGFDDETDGLVMVDMSSVPFDVKLWRCIWNNLPASSQQLGKVKGKTGIITEMVENITFEMFWNKYNDKARSSKVKTERVWNRMSRSEQVKAYNFIGKYVQSIPPTVCRKYATTYLNDQLWNN